MHDVNSEKPVLIKYVFHIVISIPSLPKDPGWTVFVLGTAKIYKNKRAFTMTITLTLQWFGEIEQNTFTEQMNWKHGKMKRLFFEFIAKKPSINDKVISS